MPAEEELPYTPYVLAFRFPFNKHEVESMPNLIRSAGKAAIYEISVRIDPVEIIFCFTVRVVKDEWHLIMDRARDVPGVYFIREYRIFRKCQERRERRPNAITSFQELRRSKPDPFDVIGRVSKPPRLRMNRHGLFWYFKMIDEHGCKSRCKVYTDNKQKYAVGAKLRGIKEGDVAVCTNVILDKHVCMKSSFEKVKPFLRAKDSYIMFFNQ